MYVNSLKLAHVSFSIQNTTLAEDVESSSSLHGSLPPIKLLLLGSLHAHVAFLS